MNELASIHGDVPAEQFFRHISADLPDPVRLRQLFIYSFQRIMDRKEEARVGQQESMELTNEDEVEIAGKHPSLFHTYYVVTIVPLYFIIMYSTSGSGRCFSTARYKKDQHILVPS